MQDSYNKIDSEMRKNPLFWILIISPFILYALTFLLPTFDDWTYFTTPYHNFGDIFVNRLLPNLSYWRPWDALFGYILSCFPSLFPLLNHIAVYTAHLGCCFIVWLIGKQLNFNDISRFLCTFFFFVSPAMLGTILGIDSLNQAWAQFWGLLSTYFYLSNGIRYKKQLWLLCVTIGIFSKENAIVFFAIPPIIAYSFNYLSLKKVFTDYGYAIVVTVVYIIARTILTDNESQINEEYFDNSITLKIKNIATLLGMTWVALDYISLIYAPCRNLLMVFITLFLSSPFIIYVFWNQRKHIPTKPFLGLLLCFFIAASPHLATIFSSMHPYASLGMASLMLGLLMDKFKLYKTLTILFLLFLLSCIFIDSHHWYKSYESGLTGKKMGKEAIEKTYPPTDSLGIITVKRGEPKYSSFCVIPADAFGWGSAAFAETEYKWPHYIDNNIVESMDCNRINELADSCVAVGFKRVWLVHGDTVDVIR